MVQGFQATQSRDSYAYNATRPLLFQEQRKIDLILHREPIVKTNNNIHL